MNKIAYLLVINTLYILDDVDEQVSGAKKSSKELASVLRNLKKVEQALETVDAAFHGI